MLAFLASFMTCSVSSRAPLLQDNPLKFCSKHAEDDIGDYGLLFLKLLCIFFVVCVQLSLT